MKLLLCRYHCFLKIPNLSPYMKNQILDLDRFAYKTLDTAAIGGHSGSEASFVVDVIPARMVQRVLIGFFDEKTRKGISVAFFPATGEVCDLTNDGGVIGYLSNAPMIPGDPVTCELKISRFGRNLVCSVRINGELFLYPSYVAANGRAVLTAVVGQESDGSNAMIGWTKAHVASNSESSPVAA